MRGWGWGVGGVTHPAAQIEGPAAHLLVEEREPGAQDSCLGSRLLRPCWSLVPRVHDPYGPSPAPVSSPPDSPSLSTPGRRSLASLGRLPAFFVCLCLGAFLHCAHVCLWAYAAYVCVSRPPCRCPRSCSRPTIVAQRLAPQMWPRSRRGARSEASSPQSCSLKRWTQSPL